MKERTHTQPTTSVFLTFETNHAKNLLCHLNTPKDTIFLTKNRLCTDSSNFTIKFQDEQFKTYIKEAPEPEDIIWTNIGQSVSQMVLRKLLTYSITAVILGGSFAIIFFLSREQVNNSNDAFLSFVISFSITVINIIIQSTSFLTHSRHSRPNKFRKRRDPHELPKRTGLEIYFRSGHQLDLVALRCQVLHPREFVQS